MLHSRKSRSALLLPVLLTVLVASPSALAGKKLDGRWQLSITIPVSPNSDNSRTFDVTLDVSPRAANSLHGRLTVTDPEGRTVGGVWRQSGKRVSITYELPCASDQICASLILLGNVKGGGLKIKGGSVIVMWDTPNDRNHAQYDTSNGSFVGDRLP